MHTNAWSVHSSNTPVQSGIRTSKMISITLKWSSAVQPGSSVETTVAKRGRLEPSRETGLANPARAQESCSPDSLLQDSQQARYCGHWLLRASRRNTINNSALSPAFINIQTTKNFYKYSFFLRTVADWKSTLLSNSWSQIGRRIQNPLIRTRSPSSRLAASPPPVQTAHVISLVEFVCLNHQNQK